MSAIGPSQNRSIRSWAFILAGLSSIFLFGTLLLLQQEDADTTTWLAMPNIIDSTKNFISNVKSGITQAKQVEEVVADSCGKETKPLEKPAKTTSDKTNLSNVDQLEFVLKNAGTFIRTNATLNLGTVHMSNLIFADERRSQVQALEEITGVQFDLHPAVGPEDGRILKLDKEHNITGISKLTGKELGIWLSHHAAWESILLNHHDGGMILEDDIDMEVEIRVIWKAIMDATWGTWDIMYTGWCFDDSLDRESRPGKFVSEVTVPGYGEWKWRLYKPTFAACTHAYAINYKAAQFLNSSSIFYKTKDRLTPVDMYLANGVVNKGELRTVMLHPPIFKQRGGLPQGDNLRQSAIHEMELREKIEKMRKDGSSEKEVEAVISADVDEEEARRRKEDVEVAKRLKELWEAWKIDQALTPEEREAKKKAEEAKKKQEEEEARRKEEEKQQEEDLKDTDY